MTILDHALTLWRRGLSVIPVPSPGGRSDGKRPVIAWKEFQTTRATYYQVKRWFGNVESSNLAVITGTVSGIVVVDVDDKGLLPWVKEHLTPTPWCVKTASGWHCYYRHPGGLVGNRVRLAGVKIDVRGDGGYVIGPGSVHRSGHVYRTTGDWSARLATLPVLDASLLEEKTAAREVRTPAFRPTGQVAERARLYLKSIPVPVNGAGSDRATFYAACRIVRGFGLGPITAVELLSEWAPHFDRWWLELKVASAQRFGTEPEGSLK